MQASIRAKLSFVLLCFALLCFAVLTCAMLSARLCRSLGRAGKEGGGGVEEAVRKHTSEQLSLWKGKITGVKRCINLCSYEAYEEA